MYSGAATIYSIGTVGWIRAFIFMVTTLTLGTDLNFPCLVGGRQVIQLCPYVAAI